jgi:GAF domain
MDALVSLFVGFRRTGRRALPLLGALLLASVVAVQAAEPLDESIFTGFVLMLLVWLAARAYKRTASVLDDSRWLDVEIGALLMITAYAVAIHVDGSLDGRFYALIYVAVGVMSAFAKPSASMMVIALMMAFEAGVRQLAYGGLDPQKLLPHLGFAIVFGLLNTLSLRMEVARLRKASRSELEAERDRIREEARSYRLLRAPAGAASDEQRLLESGVEEIELVVLFALRLLRSCLDVHTAMLLWLDGSGSQLRISELVCDDPDVCEGPFSTRDGIVGAVLAHAQPVRVGDLKPNYLLPYYASSCPVKAVCAVPVFEHGSLRGVLVVDRKRRSSFDDDELALVEQAARFVARAIENERVFVQLERTKVEQGKLYRAAEQLGAAISE